MNAVDLKAMVSDWRVALLIVLVVLSLIAIGPHFDSEGNLATNLQYGLDLQQGAWIQLEFKAVVVGFDTDRDLNGFVTELSEKLDTEVELIDATHLEIRKAIPQAELEQVFADAGGKVTTYSPGVSRKTAETAKLILENKINSFGTKDAKVQTLTGLNNVARYVRIELAGVDMRQAQAIVGNQGKFEIRIQTVGNETEPVLFGDAITSGQNPSQEPPGRDKWGVGVTLPETGAAACQHPPIRHGPTSHPEH
ncbi:MAG: preprotein translocase subunit SecD, partial [Methanoregula sp.]